MKIALVYDRVNKWGGAERLLLALHQIYPQAPLFTSLYAPQSARWAHVFDVHPSFINRFPGISQQHQRIPFLMPFAFESFNFSQYDVVISLTSAEAKGIITPPRTLHICYCLTPTRYLYSHASDYLHATAFPGLVKPVLARLKQWDLVAAQRPDHYLAISATVRDRIKQYYHRQAEVIYPPPTSHLNINSSSPGKYFLVVSRLEPYKQVDKIIEIFNELGWPLVIIGSGSQENKYKARAKKNIRFVVQLTDSQLFDYYRSCIALIMPQEEDFGLVSLEVQAAGKPVVALRKGGATETVIEGKTGIFFEKLEKKQIIRALKRVKKIQFRQADFAKNLSAFSPFKFSRKFSRFVEAAWQQHQKIK